MFFCKISLIPLLCQRTRFLNLIKTQSESQERSAAINKMLGKVPYLNGGIFQKHQIEELHGKQIQVSDRAFERMFEFFEQYQWHLDERPLRADNEINPDVLGYIFEKYINQKQMGAYYTKEDITGYISKSTIIPYLFETARQKCKIAFEGEKTVWELLKIDPERYIYESVKKGVALSLPPEVATGLDDVAKRSEWNKPAPVEYALPTETWREVVSRRKRYEETRSNLVNGEIHDINDLITYNLDLRQFAQDVIENCEGPELLRAFWHAIENITVLDPTCGSGAFLFAALNILEQLYEACLDRMQAFIEDLERSNQKHRPEKFSDFRKILERVTQHPSRRYFIFKSIIINNLYGVDIMEEAVEICKLRLFLKLIAQVDYEEQIEPLPDIDFNIRAGNTLVGYATSDEVRKAMKKEQSAQMLLVYKEDLDCFERFNQKMEDLEKLFALFRRQQTELEDEVTPDDKKVLRERLKSLENELNIYLAKEYGVDIKRGAIYEKWKVSHKPFHWFIEFYGIFKKGGFDVIIGNPPYVEYSKVRSVYRISGYATERCGNLYGFVIERSNKILNEKGLIGMIVPISAFSNSSMETLQTFFKEFPVSYISSFHQRPAALFEGVLQRLSIFISYKKQQNKDIFSTMVYRWKSETRDVLFPNIFYTPVNQMFQKHLLKIGNIIEASILDKWHKHKEISIYLSNSMEPNNKIYYRTAGGGYWVTILNSEFDTSALSNKSAPFQKKYNSKVFSAVLNSNLFWWYYSINFDQFNFKDYMIFGFRFNYPIDKLMEKRLIQLSDMLENELLKNATTYIINSKTRGSNETITYKKYLSKVTMDKIDNILAEHYGFSPEELDFIINYDIKYRMSSENDAEEDE